MRRLTHTLLTVLLVSLAIPAFAQGPQANVAAPKATISGTVVRVNGGNPVNRATISLVRAGGPANPGQPPQPQQANAGGRGAVPGLPGGAPQGQQAQQNQQVNPNVTVLTDDQGKFQFKDVDPGNYRIVAAKNGFARMENGAKTLNRPGTVLNVRAGQTINDIAFKLTPAATISGRVLDSMGEPLTGVTVSALRSSFDATGKRNMQSVGSARTNDLGEYRIYWINPGRYFVNANTARSASEIIASQAAAAQGQVPPEQAQAVAAASSILGPGGNPNEVADTSYGLTYYPGTNDPTRAIAVDLQPGAEIRGVDFTLMRQQRVKISGKVVDETGKPPAIAQVMASPRDSTSNNLLDSLLGADPTGARYNPQTGEFTVGNVGASTSYWLQVITQPAPQMGPNGQPIVPTDPLAIIGSINQSRIPIEVGTTDVENVTITATAGVSISGRIRIEGAQDGQAGLERVGVALTATSGIGSILSILGGAGAKPAADGTFTIPRINSGDYRLTVNGMGQTLYIKQARLGQLDATQPLSLSMPISGALDIVLGPNPGQVTGTLTDAALKPVVGVQAVLVPEALGRNRPELYKTANTDAEGRFTFRAITPGDYKVFAWEDIEPFSYFDSAVLQRFEQQGKLVHVVEGSAETADVKIIPAQQ